MKHILGFLLLSLAAMALAGSALAQVGGNGQKPTATTTPDGQTLINIHLKQAVAEDAFGELHDQSGVRFTTNMNTWDLDSLDVPKDVDITNQPFWTALRQLSDLWNVNPMLNPNVGEPPGIMLMAQVPMPGLPAPAPREKETRGPVVQKGGVEIEVRSFNLDVHVPYYSPASRLWPNFTGFVLDVCVDPCLGTTVPTFTVDQADDDAGNSLLPDKETAKAGFRQPEYLLFRSYLPLRFPHHPGKKITALKGNLELRVIDKTEDVTVAKPLEAAETSKQVGDLTFVFHSLKQENGPQGGYVLSVTINRGATMVDAAETWAILRQAKLLDDKGRALFTMGGNGGAADYQLHYMSPAMFGGPGGSPVKLTVSLPAQSHVVNVPFEFTDLPMQ